MPLLPIIVAREAKPKSSSQRLTPRDTDGEKQKELQQEEEDSRAILCAHCRNAITTPEQQATIAGQHLHTMFNPAGIIYEISSFYKAPGVVGDGTPSSDFSWFAGYLWQIVVCRKCRTHLGWRFTSSQSNAPTFFGLIIRHLIHP